jgi:hypothetical protein
MTITFSKLLSDCLIALGDADASTWSRTNTIWAWVVEAMLAFPIMRPKQQTFTTLAATHAITLNTDFREIVEVEYPVDQDPPAYLTRMNRLDPNFFNDETHYDIDRNYEIGSGWTLYVSRMLQPDEEVYINYLATHETDLADDEIQLITIPDEYENILIAYVVAKGYRERLGVYLQDPTAHTSLIMQMTDMVEKADARYQQLVRRAEEKLAHSRTSPHMQVDTFDRVY